MMTNPDALKSALDLASEQFGVERQFWDIFGNLHQTSVASQTALLSSLGVDSSSPESLGKAVEEETWREWSQPLPATLVLSQSRAGFTLSIPAELRDATADWAVDLEDGGRIEQRLALGALPVAEERRVRGRNFVRKQVPPGEALPLGYHRLSVSIAGKLAGAARLIICPDRAYQPPWLETGKGSGVAVSLYGVRSERNWGCGDTTDLRRLIDWSTELGTSFIALNPLHAIPNRQPYNTSPYLPNSIFYRNHIYLDLEKIEDFPTSGWAQRLFKSEKVRCELASLRASEYVEYERVSRLKLRFLKVLFFNFLLKEYRRNSERAAAFQAYVDREGTLLDLFAVHSALDEVLHKQHPEAWNWHSWPAAYQNPDSPETKAFAASHWRSVLLHKYIQWQLDQQFDGAQRYAKDRGQRIGLYHDLALATDRFGSDLWAHRPFYAEGCRVGSPPDAFAPKGQDWAFPPPNSMRHFEDGYRLFAESIRKASAHGGALRIDHVMRFFRLYWIPGSLDATEGTYVKDRYQDLIRILALESVRNEFIVIGEDLGTVPDYVRETLGLFGILGYRLFFFEKDSAGRFRRPEEYPRQALVSASTHDLPTLAGFWNGSDMEARRQAGMIADDEAFRRAIAERAAEKQKMLDLLRELALLPPWVPEDARQLPELTGELQNAILGFLASTPSQLLVINQEDLFKDNDQQNLPGTTAEHPNWRHKMKYKVEELPGDALRGYSLMLRSWLERTGRLN